MRSERIVALLAAAVVWMPWYPACAEGGSTPEQRWSVGRMMEEARLQWGEELRFHQDRLAAIARSDAPPARKAEWYRFEAGRHDAQRQWVAEKKQTVHQVLIQETNARMATGHDTTTTPLEHADKPSTGTPGSRGYLADTDVEGRERAVRELRNVLRELGLESLPVRETAGTLEIADGFEMTVNKIGIDARPGTQFHRIKTEVDARHPETFLSDRMKQRPHTLGRQAGTDYVEVQDHLKKASDGLGKTGADLVRSPESMRRMGERVSLMMDTAGLPHDHVQQILRQNAISDTPEQFVTRMRNVGGGRVTITDPSEADRLRKASDALFRAAESKTFRQAQHELVRLSARAAGLPPTSRARRVFEEELVDTIQKMESSKRANAARRQGATEPSRVPRRPETAGASVAPASGISAREAFRAVVAVSQVADACVALEEYRGGDLTLDRLIARTVDNVLPDSPFATAERTPPVTRETAQAVEEWQVVRTQIFEANLENVAAYLTRWEWALRRAGVSEDAARLAVGEAVLSGDYTALEHRAIELRTQGQSIDSPVLLVEEILDWRNDWEAFPGRLWNMTTDVVSFPLYSTLYVVRGLAGRVEAGGEGELAEVELQLAAAEKTTEIKVALWRMLLREGFSCERILGALKQWVENQPTPLRQLFREARVLRSERELLAPERAEVEAAERETQRRVAKLSRLSAQNARMQSYLQWAPLTLNYHPAPVVPQEEDERVPLDLSVVLGENPRYLAQVLANWQHVLRSIAGLEVTVTPSFTFSAPVEAGERPFRFRTESPGIEGIYPLKATATFTASGPALTHSFAHFAKTITREMVVPIEVALALDAMQDPAWDILRSTSQVSISNEGRDLWGITVPVTPRRRLTFRYSRVVEFSWMPRGQQRIRQEDAVQVVFAKDGESIEELVIDREQYDESGAIIERTELRVYALAGILTEETDTQAPQAHYYWDHAHSTGRWRSDLRNPAGGRKWGEWHTVDPHSSAAYRPQVTFHIPPEELQRKRERARDVHEQRVAQAEAVQQKAASGDTYAGPFGAPEGLDGVVRIMLNRSERIFSGTFRASVMEDEQTRVEVTGEIQGTFNPDTGTFSGSVRTGSAQVATRHNGRWYPQYPEPFPRDTRVRARFENGTIRGAVIAGERRLSWEATLDLEPVAPGPERL